MAFYATNVGSAKVYLETRASGAFNKNDMEERPDPAAAVQNAVKLAETMAGYVSEQLDQTLRTTQASAEMQFGIRVDGNGFVMIADEQSSGQFSCTLRFEPRSAPAPAPTAQAKAPAKARPKPAGQRPAQHGSGQRPVQKAGGPRPAGARPAGKRPAGKPPAGGPQGQRRGPATGRPVKKKRPVAKKKPTPK